MLDSEFFDLGWSSYKYSTNVLRVWHEGMHCGGLLYLAC
jgi:hypothetical protein